MLLQISLSSNAFILKNPSEFTFEFLRIMGYNGIVTLSVLRL